MSQTIFAPALPTTPFVSIEHDAQADALYARFAARGSVKIDGQDNFGGDYATIADLDATNQVVGVEILHASKRFPDAARVTEADIRAEVELVCRA